jgi:alpha-N-arabinofuranosidase
VRRALAAAASFLLVAGCASLPAPPAGEPAAGTAAFDWFRYQGDDALPRPGPGDYANPILTGFYPDPSITRAGDDYYLVTSTFSYFPGIPVFHSRDLVSWRQIGNAIDRPDQLDFGRLGLSRGVFAPAIEHHAGTFYILNTCVDCGGNFLVTASDPAGPWSDPVWLPEIEGGIDPSLFFDADGRAWIVNNGPPEGTPLYEGHRAIWIQEFDPRAKRMIGPRRVLVNGGIDISERPIWIEGPHIIRKDGFYYLIAAEGGTAEGHSQVVLRSRSVTGPYEVGPDNPILTQRDLPRDRANPITSAGHADFVQLPDGSWWATFLAVRPYEGDHYNTGRETFLMPVAWPDGGWPRITRPGEAIPYTHRRPGLPRGDAEPMTGPFTVDEEFAGRALGFDWMMARNPRERWHELANGRLVLRARPVGLGDNGNPSFLARRQQHINASASTVMRFAPRQDGEEAGLAAFQNDEYWYFLALGREGGRDVLKVERRAGPSDPAGGVTIASIPSPVAPGEPLRLRIEAAGSAYHFSWARAGGEWQPLLRGADGKILSTRTAGGFVGAVFGLHAFAPQQEHR